MDFTIEFYETQAGRCPVREFLDELKSSDPSDFAVVVAGLAKLRNSQYHREPLSKALDDGLFELRHVGKLNTRVLWFFMKGRRIEVGAIGPHKCVSFGIDLNLIEKRTILCAKSPR